MHDVRTELPPTRGSRNPTVPPRTDGIDRYRALLDSIDEAVVRYELTRPLPVDLPRDEQLARLAEDAFVVECNEAFVRLNGGTTADYVLGQRLCDLQGFDLETYRRFGPGFIENGYRQYDQIAARTVDGDVRWISMSTFGIVQDAHLVFLWGVRRDVTGRVLAQEESRQAREAVRRSEERLRSILDNTLDIVAVLDGDAILRYVSPSIERILGVRPETWIGDHILEKLHPGDHDEAARRLAEVAASPGSTRSMVVRVRRQDGGWRHLEVFGRGRLDDDGEPTVVLSARDVTDRLHLEEQLRQAQKMEGIGQLAGGVAHDFNNLLTVIGGFASLIESDDGLPGSLRTAVREIRRASDRGASLTRQLLTLARRQVNRPEIVAINDVLGNTRNFLDRLIGEHVRVTLQLHPDAGHTYADPGELEQVVVNLAVNARDAMPRGGSLVIRTEHPRDREDGSREVVLRVQDTGHGMDPQTRERIFEPFFTTKPRGKGTGLGLATVYGIVERIGGSIRVDSEPGRGTEFRIALPFRDGPADAPHVESGPPGADGDETVLVVEDDPAIRRLVRAVLEGGGYEVHACASGDEAMLLLEDGALTPDLVLTDLVMPGLNGFELGAWIREERRGIGVLHMSGYADRDVAPHLELDPEQDLIVKPFVPSELLRRVRRCLDATHPERPPGE